MTMQIKFEVEEAEQMKKLEAVLEFLGKNGGKLIKLENHQLNTGLIGRA